MEVSNLYSVTLVQSYFSKKEMTLTQAQQNTQEVCEMEKVTCVSATF